MQTFHITLWAAVAGWMTAQITKMIICLVESRRLNFRYLVSTGGMPSAHSAMACSVATMIGLTEGFATPIFTLSFCFAAVVMFDAQTVRAAAGKQAQLLNQIVDELFKEHHLSENKLKELLGHTRLEVFFGMLTGIVSAFALLRFFPQ